MKELVFTVVFESDVVLPASSNTEGKIDQSDFIAGSNFLGMAAQNYDLFSDSFTIFHSGKVRFCDGHLVKNGRKTFKIPYSFCHPKLDSETIYNHHLLKNDDFKNLGQLKQIRNGYITCDFDQVYIEYRYSQKSAYDKSLRRSKDSQMYGYNAITKGTHWQFSVKTDGISSDDERLLIETLSRSTRLGRSKSSEYGQIRIEYIEDKKVADFIPTSPSDHIVLYCSSRLALTDDNGNPTYDLTCLCEGLSENNIVYDKSQIRISSFTPYNGARATKDYERVCINKGSVLVLKDIGPEQISKIQNGVGAYLSEGFGEVLINPNFLMEKKVSLTKESNNHVEKDKRTPLHINTDDKTVLFLQNRHNQNLAILDVAKEVAEFVQKNKTSLFSNITSSQWGNIRSIASSRQNDFIEKITSYIGTGTKKWKEQQSKILIEAINKHTIDKQQFIQLLAMKMGGKND